MFAFGSSDRICAHCLRVQGGGAHTQEDDHFFLINHQHICLPSRVCLWSYIMVQERWEIATAWKKVDTIIDEGRCEARPFPMKLGMLINASISLSAVGSGKGCTNQ